MKKHIISQGLRKFLETREFISVGSCDLEGRPNVAPKFLLKVKGDFIYLVDYIIGKTWRNLKVNPKFSISTLKLDTLMGYQLNGRSELINQGKVYKTLFSEYKEKQIDLSAVRVARGVRRGRKHPHTEVTFPEKVIFFKMKVEEIVKIVPTGKLNRSIRKK